MCEYKSGSKILRLFVMLYINKEKMTKTEIMQKLKISERSLEDYIKTINCNLFNEYIYEEIIYNRKIKIYEIEKI